jgi:hypothetical protein
MQNSISTFIRKRINTHGHVVAPFFRLDNFNMAIDEKLRDDLYCLHSQRMYRY